MARPVHTHITRRWLQKYFETIRNLFPDEQKDSVVGLDIGTGECKLVELAKSDNDFVLINWIIEPIRNGDIKAAIEKSLSRLAAPCKSLYTSVFGKGTLTRYIDLPRMSPDDLRSSFDIEADKYFPFAQDQIYTDCHILEVNEKEKTMSVMAVAAKKELVERRIKLLADLGMACEFIGLNPIVLANLVSVLGLDDGEIQKHSKKSAVALLDMGESVSTLTILVDKVPRFTRDIFIGGRDCTKAIGHALGIGFQEAEQLKIRPQERLKEAASACESVVMNMIQELRLSMDYFATERNYETGTLLLTGGSSLLEGITDAFEKNLEIKVDRWSPMTRLKLAQGVSVENIDQTMVKLGVALGLAVYQYD